MVRLRVIGACVGDLKQGSQTPVPVVSIAVELVLLGVAAGTALTSLTLGNS